MKKLLGILFILMLLTSNGYCADQWDKDAPAGTVNISDLDTVIGINNEALDRILSTYRNGATIVYKSVSDIYVYAGEVVCSNSAGSVRKFRQNTSNTTVTWANLDTGVEQSSKWYYIYAVADTDVTTFTCVISVSSSAPAGCTYYLKLGSFYNNAAGDITTGGSYDIANEAGMYTSSEISDFVSGASVTNADTVDNIHAATTATANYLLALNASGKLPASITGDAGTVDGYDGATLLTSGHVKAAQGTVAHGGTIPLPTGYTQTQSKWMIGRYNVTNQGGLGITRFDYSVTSNRVVTAQNYTTGGGPYNGTVSYIIIGIK